MFNKTSAMAVCAVVISMGCSFSHGQEKPQWFRGNTHTHTEVCGHADSLPHVVAKWYHDKGYNFLILSEHNYFIDPKTVTIEGDRRKDFILIPGIELTEKIHSTCMNVKGLVKTEAFPKQTTIKQMIQSHVERAHLFSGETILNHPNFQWTVAKEDMDGVNGLRLFELFNGHPHVHNDGDDKRASTEKIWDYLLTQGNVLYGVSSDDAHHFKPANIKPSFSNPGRGWVMVNAPHLEADAITKAMTEGHFYSSNGVFLEECRFDEKGYSIVIDIKRTIEELKSPILRGKVIEKGIEGFRVEWIAKEGAIVRTDRAALSALYLAKPADGYVRPKIVYTRQHPTAGWEEYYAWGQPQFFDGRK